MSYTPTQWQTGDTITAEKLNNMESGIENANEPFVITLTPTAQDLSGTMDKTPQEITDAYNAGQDIEFDIPSLSVKCKAMEFAVKDSIIQAGAIVTYRTGDSHLLIEVLTSPIPSGSTYQTHIYSLTPMS